MPRLLALIALLLSLCNSTSAQSVRGSLPPEFQTELVGVKLEQFPYFTATRAHNEGTPIFIGVDTLEIFRVSDQRVDVYVTTPRTVEEWKADGNLLDVRGSPTEITLRPGGVKYNRHRIDAGTLNGQTGTTEVGIGYDLVVDMNQNGVLDAADLLDGWGEEAGFYVMPDLTQDGPYETIVTLNNQGGFIVQRIFYPANIEQLGALPLIVVSHGNGHDYRWYDHIGNFMASWGYVVISHRNNTGPGIEAASTTTLRNTNNFLSLLGEIDGGILAGHVDRHQLVWIGHSRGGEGVVRAYRRILDGDQLGENYVPEDFKLISSIAPVNFLLPAVSDPGDAPYHLWTGGADDDVNGCANCNQCQTFHLHERATGTRSSISLHGVGHADFHDGPGGSVADGPCRVGRARTHEIMRGYLLPLVKHFVDGNIPCQDYLWRQWESFRPIGAPDFPCVVVDLMYQVHPNTGKAVLDDFQSNPQRVRSSSGGKVVFSDPNLAEGPLDDRNNSFTSGTDAMNGMTLAGNNEFSSGAVFEWNGENEFVLFEVPENLRDVSAFSYLSFRAAQSTRHPLTNAALEDLTFSVQLADENGRMSTIWIGSYGGGIEEPYQRRSCGPGGPGWANEFETIRIPLRDYQSQGTLLDLRRVVAVGFLVGPDHGSNEGRIGLDEIEFTRH